MMRAYRKGRAAAPFARRRKKASFRRSGLGPIASRNRAIARSVINHSLSLSSADIPAAAVPTQQVIRNSVFVVTMALQQLGRANSQCTTSHRSVLQAGWTAEQPIVYRRHSVQAEGLSGLHRSLQLNGITLDLEERAKITPGVQAGCPGHCSSYGSLCQNQGRYVERSNSFSCNYGSSAYTGVFCDREVSASLKSGTSISYTFKEQVVNELNRSNSVQPSSIYSDMILRAENISLSFRTTQSPALLLYVGSYHREYLALLLNKHDKLEVRYRLDSSKDAEILRSKVRNLANGQLHTITINRLADAASVQIDQNTKEDFNLTSDVEFSGIRSLVLGRVHNSGELDPELARIASLGFTGCLSAVLFNSISPLKAALLHPDTSPVTVIGPLAQSICGSTSANSYAAETTHHLSGHSGSVGTGQPLVNAIRSDSALIGEELTVMMFNC
ncbi:contactin-associated protein-like 4 [Lates japonicus]|uniref:Contactin-associated protein-like 4 n=1 Tax=Lates japonicus TaxID=270547 RepID=A0AAD3NHH8_LATJO|nr:contactin-associated protein-like 4 [Lates japonicus]